MKTNFLNTVKTVSLFGLMVLFFSSAIGQTMPIAKLDKETSRKGEIVWIDLVTNDAKASKKFFSNLLGWSFNNHDAYDMALSGTKPVSGIIEDRELLKGSKTSYWVVSNSVTDAEATAKKIKSQGGKVLSEPMEISGRGTVALVEDAQGAFFSIIENSSGDPKASAPRNGEWMWAELWTSNPKKATSFYTDVLSVSAKPLANSDGEEYFILKGATYEFGGITKIPVKNEPSIWIPVLRVEDAAGIAEKAVKLGGSILIGPVTVSGNKVALITTPSGAPFLVQEWDL